MVTTTRTADYIGRALITPDSDARDYLARATITGDRDFIGRALTGGEGDPVQALLDEAAVRFDFSEYDDINDMVDVNGGWGPLVDLAGSPGTIEFTANGLQITSDGINSASLRPGLGTNAPGPLLFGEGLTLVHVAMLNDPIADDVAFRMETTLLQANSDGDAMPNLDKSDWGVTQEAAYRLYDTNEDEVADLYHDFGPRDALPAGVFMFCSALDSVAQEVRIRLVGPGIDENFEPPFEKPVPDFVGDPQIIDDMVSRILLTFTGSPSVVSMTSVEWVAWNRALTPAEVDDLVAHFTA